MRNMNNNTGTEDSYNNVLMWVSHFLCYSLLPLGTARTDMGFGICIGIVGGIGFGIGSGIGAITIGISVLV